MEQCKSVYYLQPDLSSATDDSNEQTERNEVLDGLHAKVFVIDRGRNASVFTGSFNATVHAFRHNVEFMVELVGKKSWIGVNRFLEQVTNETRFSDMLQKFSPGAESPHVDQSKKQLEKFLERAKRALVDSRPSLTVSATDTTDIFDMRLRCARLQILPAAEFQVQDVEVRVWPITQRPDRAEVFSNDVAFVRLSYDGLTPLIAFSIKATREGREAGAIFVMNLPLEGAPADRNERVLASMLSGRDQLLRYILFLLAAGGDGDGRTAALADMLMDKKGLNASGPPLPCLLESMLRALHRNPDQLQRVASLLDALRKSPNGSALLSADFQSIWEPIWQAAQEITGR